MKQAIISDIHSNLEALTAVLEDIRSQDIEDVLCLGDVVGYGPNPRECIDLVMQHCRVCLLGNHDQGVLNTPEGFGPAAERAIIWTRELLEQPGEDPTQNVKRWNFLSRLPTMHRDSDRLFVHGSAYDPLHEYVFPDDVFNVGKMERIFSLVPQYCFQGHSHLPGVFTDRLMYYNPSYLEGNFQLASEKVLINVGSVGQPRDGDNRACYVVLETDPPPAIKYRRVDYPREVTQAKIYQAAGLDNSLGDRLLQGH